jgi:hypothetical protein
MTYESRQTWLDQFAARLCRLVDQLTFDEAHGIAWTMYAELGSQDPVEAANLYATKPIAAQTP